MGSEFRVQSSEFRVLGSEFWVLSSEFRVKGYRDVNSRFTPHDSRKESGVISQE